MQAVWVIDKRAATASGARRMVRAFYTGSRRLPRLRGPPGCPRTRALRPANARPAVPGRGPGDAAGARRFRARRRVMHVGRGARAPAPRKGTTMHKISRTIDSPGARPARLRLHERSEQRPSIWPNLVSVSNVVASNGGASTSTGTSRWSACTSRGTRRRRTLSPGGSSDSATREESRAVRLEVLRDRRGRDVAHRRQGRVRRCRRRSIRKIAEALAATIIARAELMG